MNVFSPLLMWKGTNKTMLYPQKYLLPPSGQKPHLWISQAFTGFLDLPWIHKYADCKNSSVPLRKSGWVVNTWNYQRWPIYAFEWTLGKKQKNVIARIFWPLWLGFQSQSFQLWTGWIIQGDKSDAAPATWGRLVFYVAVEPGCMHYAQR